MKLKERKKKYRIKPIVKFDAFKDLICFLPTIAYLPSKYSNRGNKYVFIIYWLTFAIAIGIWEERRSDTE